MITSPLHHLRHCVANHLQLVLKIREVQLSGLATHTSKVCPTNDTVISAHLHVIITKTFIIYHIITVLNYIVRVMNIMLCAWLSQPQQGGKGGVTSLDASVSVDAVVNKQHQAIQVVGVEAHGSLDPLRWDVTEN